MQLIDIKNDLAKVVYTPLARELCLADFLLISDDNQNLLAQVIHIETTPKPNANLALIKFILSVDKDGVVTPYDGYVPAKDANISYMEPAEIVELLKTTEETMPWGAIAAHKEAYVSLDVNLLKNKPYIQCDNLENASDVINNIVTGLAKYNKKVIIIDFDGTYSDVNTTKLVITQDFKLPLNYDSFDYIYENDLEGMDLQSRAMIQDILLDLQQYVQTTKEGFLPFNTFKAVVDEEYKKAANPGIILLRNKLIKYAQQGLFAQKKEDFDIIDEWIEKEDVLLVDASLLRPTWQKIVLNFILSQINKECHLILNLTDTNSDKKTITKLYNANSKVYPIVTTSYNYAEAQLLKAIANNLILFTPIEKVNDFAGYNSFLSKLNYDEFIIWGEDTLHIPLILKLSLMTNTHVSNQAQEEIARSVDSIFKSEGKPLETPEQLSIDMIASEEEAVQPEIAEIPTSENIDDGDIFNELLDGEEQEPVSEAIENFDITEDNEYQINETPTAEIENILDNDYQINELSDEEPVNFQDSILDDLEIGDDAEIVENDIPAENDLADEEVDYSSIFSDEDLDFIDELNENQLSEPAQAVSEPIMQPQPTPKPTPTPTAPVSQPSKTAVPIFDAEVEPKIGAGQTNLMEVCKEGTFVYHQKYGKGLVEKVINYGNKTLCSIQFDNVGRRLLDPTLAELKIV